MCEFESKCVCVWVCLHLSHCTDCLCVCVCVCEFPASLIPSGPLHPLSMSPVSRPGMSMCALRTAHDKSIIANSNLFQDSCWLMCFTACSLCIGLPLVHPPYSGLVEPLFSGLPRFLLVDVFHKSAVTLCIGLPLVHPPSLPPYSGPVEPLFSGYIGSLSLEKWLIRTQ